ncbi:MAG TPA: hypothetical protein DCS79_02410, partial [Gammaproteobacteria bacterium]|nr:hypothetical protein [Gammaproteobacteria bacterium]
MRAFLTPNLCHLRIRNLSSLPSARWILLASLITLVLGCTEPETTSATAPAADLIIDNARIYTFAWDEPDG